MYMSCMSPKALQWNLLLITYIINLLLIILLITYYSINLLLITYNFTVFHDPLFLSEFIIICSETISNSQTSQLH